MFLILQLTKKDALTGLLNRQAYYSYIKAGRKDVTGVISIDMNGLKPINDNEGHIAGDKALVTLSECFLKASKNKHLVFRLGGDEFFILCRKTNEDELKEFVKEIKKNVRETKYSCSIGYCYCDDSNKDLEEYAKESDKMMYEDKARYYQKTGIDRRKE